MATKRIGKRKAERAAARDAGDVCKLRRSTVLLAMRAGEAVRSCGVISTVWSTCRSKMYFLRGVAVATVVSVAAIPAHAVSSVSYCSSLATGGAVGAGCLVDWQGSTYKVNTVSGAITALSNEDKSRIGNSFWTTYNLNSYTVESGPRPTDQASVLVGSAFGYPNSLGFGPSSPLFVANLTPGDGLLFYNFYAPQYNYSLTPGVFVMGSAYVQSFADASWGMFNVEAAGSPTTASSFFYSELYSSASVPAPLPLLGAAVAFGYSRRIRKRIAAQKFR